MTVPPKLRLILIIIVLLGGIAFIVFAVFFNRGYLEINSEPPFSTNIVGLRSVECESSPCDITLAPGKYSLEISKPEYLSVTDQVEINLGQTTKKDFSLQLQPRLLPQGPWNPDQLFTDNPLLSGKILSLTLSLSSTDWTVLNNKISAFLPLKYFEISTSGEWAVLENQSQTVAINFKKEQSPISLFPDVSYFFAPQSSVLYFITDHPKTHLPALFKKDLASEISAESLINFVRALKNPRLIINQEQTRLALIEQPDQQTTNLYLLDLQAKTRKLIDQNGLVKDFLWLPAKGEEQYFLLEKINAETFQPNLYLINTKEPENQLLLPLNLHLASVYPLDSEQLLLAQAFDSLPDGSTANGFNIVKFNLSNRQGETIFSQGGYELPTKIEYSPSNKTLFLLIGNTVYSLSPLL